MDIFQENNAVKDTKNETYTITLFNISLLLRYSPL